jgi:hypothetical protein
LPNVVHQSQQAQAPQTLLTDFDDYISHLLWSGFRTTISAIRFEVNRFGMLKWILLMTKEKLREHQKSYLCSLMQHNQHHQHLLILFLHVQNTNS